MAKRRVEYEYAEPFKLGGKEKREIYVEFFGQRPAYDSYEAEAVEPGER